ncbi:alkaline phosphatase family protein [Janibacter sp. CX7]|uniref:alkaline phosphatase D family protein n=1 Tax=Janibacter sp. CX7 TaxID=2963431 RepID=UPI0020CD479A|nr:alkaline phosphatase D family protein [Janibacter sp. CX7]UTT66465.1 alkaline phosphatase family protein [Janibacter sp. CX7]
MTSTSPLVLGPLLRFVGEHDASVWVETAAPARVTVAADGRAWHAASFVVEGHHYALVLLDGLEPGRTYDYTVSVDDEQVWPLAGSDLPPSSIATLDHARPTLLAFGSCRTSVPHDAEHHASHGVDALRTFALSLAKGESHRPDVLALLGDQVYADETSPEMHDFIASRRDIEEPPGEEIKDYAEYSHLYQLAWSDPAIRWVLSVVPSAMIFDDHDIRDDWNTSWSWHQEINRTPWWHERLVAGLTSYWVHQHIGNLAPEELAQDEIWARLDGAGPGEVDLTVPLRALAERVDRQPETYRWSYTRALGGSRLIMLDSRAARVLEPERRSMLDDDELAWLDEQMTGDLDHLFVGTSLPFLLPPGLHDAEAISESFAGPDRSQPVHRATEALRQVVDLEHWGAFQSGFTEVFDLVMSVARGERGTAPGTITFLSGDVHHSYVAEVSDPASHGARSRIVQAVCSPIRNPMPRSLRVLMSQMAKGLVRPMRWLAARTDGVPELRYPWELTEGPWFDNNLAMAQVQDGRLTMRWVTGDVVDGDDAHPRLRVVSTVEI